jgi:RimJ/RimL family protein N-acetyltransferase
MRNGSPNNRLGGRGEQPPIEVVSLFTGSQIPGVDGSAHEIGWWLDPRHWGRGIAVEAASAVRDDAFRRLGAERLVARFQPANGASERVATKLGLRFKADAVGGAGEAIKICVLKRRDWEDRAGSGGG